jgi:ABC-type multidrug transport system ATPase subunit
MKATISDTEFHVLKEEKEEIHFNSGFNFLRAHGGYRPSKLSIVLGLRGAGKSTLRNSLICDFTSHNPTKKIALLLTEETEHDAKLDLRQIGIINSQNIELRSRMSVDGLNKFGKPLLQEIKDILSVEKSDLFILDNLTTDKTYNRLDPRAQGDLAWKIKELANELNIPFIIFMHPNKTVSETFDGLLSMSHIKGSGEIADLAEFFYILQQFEVGSVVCTTLRTTKYRGQKCNERIFKLMFSAERRFYTGDLLLTWDKFNEFYSNRNRLQNKRTPKKEEF